MPRLCCKADALACDEPNTFPRNADWRIVNTWQGDKVITKDGKESQGVKQPDGNTYDPLLMATRVHANLLENMPITLILAALAELNGADRKKLTSVLAAFTLIRISHAIGLTKGIQVPRAIGE